VPVVARIPEGETDLLPFPRLPEAVTCNMASSNSRQEFHAQPTDMHSKGGSKIGIRQTASLELQARALLNHSCCQVLQHSYEPSSCRHQGPATGQDG